MKKFMIRKIFLLAAVLATVISISPVQAQMTQQNVINNATETVQSILTDEDLTVTRRILPKAEAVLIFPELLKAGFIVGGQGGTGVLIKRRANGTWGYPAFFRMASGSIGFQAGVESSQAMFFIMNDKALDAVTRNEFKVGADAGIAIGPLGAGVGAATTANLNKDIYTFAKSEGLYGGGAFNGSVINSRVDWNEEYYGRNATLSSILEGEGVENPGAETLRNILTDFSNSSGQS